jgi:hypothetical protein
MNEEHMKKETLEKRIVYNSTFKFEQNHTKGQRERKCAKKSQQ